MRIQTPCVFPLSNLDAVTGSFLNFWASLCYQAKTSAPRKRPLSLVTGGAQALKEVQAECLGVTRHGVDKGFSEKRACFGELTLQIMFSMGN